VLIVFSSQSLQTMVAGIGLPQIPLVPVSSSQAVVGAVCGLALARGVCGIRQIKWTVLRNIAIGWIATPVVAAVISYIALFVVQNVFEQVVYM
jgi:PiT family inorganic phosphate transporter